MMFEDRDDGFAMMLFNIKDFGGLCHKWVLIFPLLKWFLSSFFAFFPFTSSLLFYFPHLPVAGWLLEFGFCVPLTCLPSAPSSPQVGNDPKIVI